MKRLTGYLRWGMALVIMLACVTGCASSNNDQAFFRNKTITIIVPHGANGGMDAYARLVAPFLQKHLPGSQVVVRNSPDGGGLAGRNEVFAAQPDGLTLGFTTSAGALLAEWAGQPNVHYKTTQFSFIGRINAEPHIMVASASTGLTRLEQVIKAQRITMGFAGIGSDDYYVALITARLLGYRVDANPRFLSVDDASLACVQGEVQAIQLSASSLYPQITAGTLVPIAAFSPKRDVRLTNVPTIFEAIGADKQDLMKALVAIYELDRTLIGPPNLPAGRLQALRDALDKAIADPEFEQYRIKAGRPVNYLPGREVIKLLETISADESRLKPLAYEVANAAR